MSVLVRVATPSDYADILALQEENYLDNVAPDKRSDGFVSTRFSLELMQQLEVPNRFYVAREEETGKLVGYVFAGSWRFCAIWPTFEVAIARFPIKWKGEPISIESTFQYGPVCIAQDFRGQGVLPRLFEAVKVGARDDFPVGTTWINAANGRSLKAHVQKLGFVPLDEWEWEDKRFVMLGFETGL
ncbi:hypothetical protein IAD21_05935 [Abditibacteriota bacterium]|nr:hypothetical protein IAD21_05935 [Abditibacteriota bacterium]